MKPITVNRKEVIVHAPALPQEAPGFNVADKGVEETSGHQLLWPLMHF